ncbi:DUF6911 family protein [Chromobacterium haemolyticum]|uniref:DUF6911 family protein n=1 Tax=Chromobacterium haemolyticum TaxID=394935 RepID=UPI001269D7DF|nr:hypothetical protein [Chromobacterium haemolyticum]
MALSFDEAGLKMRSLDKSMSPPANHVVNPNWSVVEEVIKKAYDFDGFVEIEVEPPTVLFVSSINLKAIGGKFRIVLLTNSEDPKSELLEWWGSEDAPFNGKELFAEHEWDARTVCSDILVALQLFHEFVLTQMLSDQSLASFRSPWNPLPC